MMKNIIKKVRSGARWYLNQMIACHPEWRYGVYAYNA